MPIEQHVITGSSGEYTRDIWFLPGPVDTPHSLCLFLDGEYYLQDLQAVSIVNELREKEEIPPVSLLFVSRVSAEARHADYICNDRYSRFIADDVVRWAKESNQGIQEQDHVICGLSLSGLASAYIAFQYPGLFSYSLCQSGSFWWLADNELPLPPTKAKFWLSVGDAETAAGITHPPSGLFQRISQIDGVENAAKRFQSQGGTIYYNIYSGGHATASWQEELAPALRWLIGK